MCRKTLYLHERACSKTCKILWFYLLLSRQNVPRSWNSLVGRTSCMLEWLVWLSFGELLDATESLPLALQAAVRAMLALSGVRAWDDSPYLSSISCCLLVPLHLHDPGLPQDCFSPSLLGYCWSLSQQPILRSEKKNGEVSWCNVHCSWKGYGSDHGSRSE